MDFPDQLDDPTRGDVRIEFALARAEYEYRAANRATAAQWSAIAEVLDEAGGSPEVFVDPELPMPASERVEFAVRAAAADVALRLGLSEASVRIQAHDADTLRRRMPRVWSAFREGDASAAHARTAADLVRSLPDEREVAAQFDGALADILNLAPGRFRTRARVLRERIHSVGLAERAKAARESRGIWLEADVDGMADLTLRLPAEVALGAYGRVDATARQLAKDPTETRTLAQIRADIAGDLLGVGEFPDGRVVAPRFSVAVTVPVMTLLDLSEEPGTLDGYGPIDAETARRLAGHAPSFTRLLTHPVSGALLDIDRTSYRPPADLKRWLCIVDQTCTFPGCGRLARHSDLDHTVDRQFGGPTSAANLSHLCRHHHRLKHMTRWKVASTREGPGRRRIEWMSPTGHQRAADPPPF
ncbi:MAG TPA: DUF222 domain-containing protein [Pseudolysinimonas sp.]